MIRAELVPTRSATSLMRVSQIPRSAITCTAASRISRRLSLVSLGRGLILLLCERSFNPQQDATRAGTVDLRCEPHGLLASPRQASLDSLNEGSRNCRPDP